MSERTRGFEILSSLRCFGISEKEDRTQFPLPAPISSVSRIISEVKAVTGSKILGPKRDKDWREQKVDNHYTECYPRIVKSFYAFIHIPPLRTRLKKGWKAWNVQASLTFFAIIVLRGLPTHLAQ
jgi:hypothetical protein